MDTSNDEYVMIIKKKPDTRKPKSEKTTNLQQIENTDQQAPKTQNEPTSKAKQSRAKTITSEQTTPDTPQDEQPAKPRAKAKPVRPRTKKSQPNQMESQNGEEAQQQTRKIVDAIVVDI